MRVEFVGEGSSHSKPYNIASILSERCQITCNLLGDLEDESRYLKIFHKLQIPLWVCVWGSCPATQWFSLGWAAE